MKKSFSVVFVFCLLLLLTSCGTSGDSLDSLCNLIGSKIETYKFYNTSETDVEEVINKDLDENYYDSQYNYNFHNETSSTIIACNIGRIARHYISNNLIDWIIAFFLKSMIYYIKYFSCRNLWCTGNFKTLSIW